MNSNIKQSSSNAYSSPLNKKKVPKLNDLNIQLVNLVNDNTVPNSPRKDLGLSIKKIKTSR